MIHLSIVAGRLVLEDPGGSLTATQQSTLHHLGVSKSQGPTYAATGTDLSQVLKEITAYLDGEGLQTEVDHEITTILRGLKQAENELKTARSVGKAIKNGKIPTGEIEEFAKFAKELPRPLLEHQRKAALHMLAVPHTANFSVPGAGKTAVVVAVLMWLRRQGIVNTLFVVGPRACFQPWKQEYAITVGQAPKTEIVAGGNIHERKKAYRTGGANACDLYLTTYQTLVNDSEFVVKLFQELGNDVFFVMDEAHYIKQQDGIWANAALRLAASARKRCVLTGTPFPRTYADGINIFEALYPEQSPFSDLAKGTILNASQREQHDTARASLEPAVTDLFYRVRKDDLGLSAPQFLPPITVEMNPVERELYKTIVERVRSLTREEINRDYPTIRRLHRGRLIRMRQALSYCRLLTTAIRGYSEDLLRDNRSLASKIASYDRLERPAKIERLLHEIELLRDQGEKVVIWSNFIGALDLIQRHCHAQGWPAKVVSGQVPTEDHAETDEETREAIIAEFKDPDSNLDVLVANPAACAESISLHKTCSNAIYYDLSFNCAEYLQSLDRIHRVGGSEKKVSYYRYLQYADTVEPTILHNLLDKSERMAAVVDQDFPLCFAKLGELGLEPASYEELIRE